MLKLLKPIKREMVQSFRGKKVIVTLEPGDLINFRIKRKKLSYEISLHQVINLALMQYLRVNYRDKLKVYETKRKVGYKVRKPVRPSFEAFSKHLHIAFK